MKGLTLALSALVATSAALYLASADVDEEADLVAPRATQSRPTEVEMKPNAVNKPMSEDSQQVEEPVERDANASIAKVNLFRALESPPVVAAPVAAVAVAPPPAPVAAPIPNFAFLGSFREGQELNAIVQVGEKVEFVKPSQIISGFRIDAIDSSALSWTHESTSTKGQLRARVGQ